MDDQNQNPTFFQTLIQQLIKTVEKFAETVNSMKDAVLSGEKRYEDFSKHSQQRHEDFSSGSQQRYEDLARKIRKEEEKQKKAQQRDTYIITFVSVFAICTSVIAASYWSFQEKSVDLRRVQIAALYRQAGELQNTINTQLSKRDELMDAMVNLRGIRDEGQQQCKDSTYAEINSVSYRQKLFSTYYALLSAAYKTSGVFNESIKNKVVHFMSLVDMDKSNICAKDAATDKDLMPLEIDINEKILNSVGDLKKQKNSIMDRVENYENMDKARK